jgi:predicted Kef-type K+ transport protein
MKFDPNFTQLGKQIFFSYHPVCRWTCKYPQHIGIWWVIHKYCQVVGVETAIDQKKQAPWIFHKEDNSLWKKLFQLCKVFFNFGLLVNVIEMLEVELFSCLFLNHTLLNTDHASSHRNGTDLFQRLLSLAKWSLMCSTDTNPVIMMD